MSKFTVVGGPTIWHISAARAERLIAEGQAVRAGRTRIKLIDQGSGHGRPDIPEFGELRDDTAHWVGARKCAPTLSEAKQNTLRLFKAIKEPTKRNWR